jgi:hypothetical protein
VHTIVRKMAKDGHSNVTERRERRFPTPWYVKKLDAMTPGTAALV